MPEVEKSPIDDWAQAQKLLPQCKKYDMHECLHSKEKLLTKSKQILSLKYSITHILLIIPKSVFE